MANLKLNKLRGTFNKRFPTTAQVVKQIAQGVPNQQIAQKTGLWPESITTVKGNITRGFYAPFVVKRVDGTYGGVCRF